MRKHAQVPVLVALAAAALVLVSGFGSSGSKHGANASQSTAASSSAKSPFEGPVTVLLGNVDGGAPDFAMVFVNTPTLHTTDFLL